MIVGLSIVREIGSERMEGSSLYADNLKLQILLILTFNSLTIHKIVNVSAPNESVTTSPAPSAQNNRYTTPSNDTDGVSSSQPRRSHPKAPLPSPERPLKHSPRVVEFEVRGLVSQT